MASVPGIAPKRLGRPPKPEGKQDVSMQLRLPSEAVEKLDAAAGERGLARATMVRVIVLDWLKRHGTPAATDPVKLAGSEEKG